MIFKFHPWVPNKIKKTNIGGPFRRPLRTQGISPWLPRGWEILDLLEDGVAAPGLSGERDEGGTSQGSWRKGVLDPPPLPPPSYRSSPGPGKKGERKKRGSHRPRSSSRKKNTGKGVASPFQSVSALWTPRHTSQGSPPPPRGRPRAATPAPGHGAPPARGGGVGPSWGGGPSTGLVGGLLRVTQSHTYHGLGKEAPSQDDEQFRVLFQFHGPESWTQAGDSHRQRGTTKTHERVFGIGGSQSAWGMCANNVAMGDLNTRYVLSNFCDPGTDGKETADGRSRRGGRGPGAGGRTPLDRPRGVAPGGEPQEEANREAKSIHTCRGEEELCDPARSEVVRKLCDNMRCYAILCENYGIFLGSGRD